MIVSELRGREKAESTTKSGERRRHPLTPNLATDLLYAL